MPEQNGFNACITIDGVQATEYEVEVSPDQKTVTCWVASELGKKFSVKWWKTSYLGGATAGFVDLDGNPGGGKIVYPGERLPMEVRGLTEGATLKPFIFSSLEITDDDQLLGGPSHSDLGFIKLKITPVAVGKTIPAAATRAAPSGLSQKLKVHERSKKAVTQQVGLGEAEALPKAAGTTLITYTGPEVVVFTWRYRPLDILRASGVAPTLKRKAESEEAPAPAPTPKEVKPKLEVLQSKLNVVDTKPKPSSNKKARRVKNEDGGVIDLSDNDFKVKAEKKPRRPYVKGEVIDLT
ncbi:hypothetical protein C8F01DRAFT_1181591 [Mycena amicta]|nr:hypothetical protein C8F01DRAFT_1181591 [Mycena amicta]